MSRCRTLIAENQELGRQLSQGKVAQLEAELALQKKYSEELKESQEGEKTYFFVIGMFRGTIFQEYSVVSELSGCN